MWLGLLLVAGSVVVGARTLAAADDTTTVWAVRADRGAGTPVTTDDLEPRRIRFADDATARRYFAASGALPDDLVLARPVGAGELLARSAVGPAGEAKRLSVPLEVDPNRVPPQVRAGSVVDVWISDGGSTGSDAAPSGVDDDGPALSGVTVVAAPDDEDAFVVSGTRQLVVSVDEDVAAEFERLLGTLQDPVLRVLQRS